MTTKLTKRVRCAVYTRVSTEYGLDQEFKRQEDVAMIVHNGS